MKHALTIPCAVMLLALSCSKAPLGERRFADLLVDLHTADGILSDARLAPVGEQDKYMYYTGLFDKHGITRAEFDSCVHYYSARPERYERVYEKVIRTLERRDSANLRVWRELTKDDTVNLTRLFRVKQRDTLLREYVWYDHAIIDTLHAIGISERLAFLDTLRLDDLNPCYDIEIDSLRVGRYEMFLRVKLDSADTGKNNRIRPYFISAAGDTLRVREIIVYDDARPRDYSWNFYLQDSTYNRLRVRLVDCDSLDRPGTRRAGWVTGLRSYRKYLPPKEAERAIEQQQIWQRGR